MMKARFLAIVAAVCTCGVAQGQDEPQPSATETGLPQQQAFRFPQLGQAEAFWSRRLGGYIRSADGTRLKYSVLLPEGSGRFPVVLTINGYDAGSIGGAAYLKYQTSMSLELDRRLVEAGYAVMGVNAAGTGCSDGTLEYTRPQLGRHGSEAVEFAAAQPWSNGRVGMTGWSYGGASQLATAQRQPPSLRAIVPGMPLTDFRDALVPGGVPAPGFVTPFRDVFRAFWSELAAQAAREEGDLQCLKQIDKNLESEQANSVMHLLASHPLRDDYMKSFDLAEHADQIRVPVLSLEAFQDQAITPRSGHYHARLDPQLVWQVKSNGGHNLYLAEHFQRLALRFLDRFVKGEENGFERETPHTTVWMETFEEGQSILESRASPRPRWIVSRGLVASEDVLIKELHLSTGNALSEAATPGAADAFTYPGTGVAVNDVAGNSFWGQLPADWRQSSLSYTSAPLEQGMLVYGPGSADLWVAAGAGEADLQVTVTEVRPDGQEAYVQRGWLRLSNRALDLARSTSVLPVLLDRPDRRMPTLSGEPVFVRIEINKMGHYFRKGSRVRIWVDAPAQTGGVVFDIFSLKQRIHVLHNGKYDSLIRLGVLSGVQGPPTYKECGTMLMQPCRPDPLASR